MSNENRMTAFVDESGDHVLDSGNSGASNLFVCAAFLVNDSEIEKANVLIEQVRKKHFSGNELKSSGIGGNHRRRLAVLEALKPVRGGYFATIIDKQIIAQDSGLRYKPSFHKYMHQMLYGRLMQGLSSLQIVADEHGSKDFMDSFDSYLKKKTMPALFVDCSHRFEDSEKTPLIQMADIIAGTLTWCFDPKKQCGEFRDKFLDILQPRQMGLERWPRQRKSILKTPAASDELDLRIQDVAKNAIVTFIERYSGDPDMERQMQVALLRHMLLLAEQEHSEPAACYSLRLRQYLRGRGFDNIPVRKFQQGVIGPLRDAGIIIAGDNAGYRLAMSEADISRYLGHDRSILEPMLARLQKAHETLSIGTANEYKMLGADEYTILRELVQAFTKASANFSPATSREDIEDQDRVR